MSTTIEFPPDIEATLRERLARMPGNVTTFVVEAVREKLSRSRTLDEICVPFAESVAAAGVNLRRMGAVGVARWDARRLPIETASIDRVLANPPFGKQMSSPAEVPRLYREIVAECDRVLKPDGRAVLLVGEPEWLRPAVAEHGWTNLRQLRLRVLGQAATLGVWRKPG